MKIDIKSIEKNVDSDSDSDNNNTIKLRYLSSRTVSSCGAM